MLRARPVRFLSKKYSVRDGDREIATVSVEWFSDRGTATADGRTMHLDRESIFGGPFTLEHEGVVLAKAYKPSAFRNRFEVEIDKARVELKREGLLTRSFIVRRGKEVLGRIDAESLFTRRARIDLPDDWPLPFQLFIFWLVLIVWKRMSKN